MTLSNEVSTLVDDFVLRDRRLGDHSSTTVDVLLAEGGESRLIARSRTPAAELPSQKQRVKIPNFKYIRDTSMTMGDDADIRSRVVCAVASGTTTLGMLSLRSKHEVLSPTDVRRLHVLSALVAYEIVYLQARARVPSRLSLELGVVLRAARKEMGLSQEDLAALVGTSRISVSRWETGTQLPSRGPLRNWATALGLLAGGRSTIVAAVDATPELLELLRRDPGRLSQLSAEQFEQVVAERLDRMGYAVQRTGAVNQKDGGIDIIAIPRADTASVLIGLFVDLSTAI